MHEIVVRTQESAKKLENFLKKEFPIGYIRKLLRKNGVRINGRRAKAEDLVCPGDRIQLYVEFEKKASRDRTQSLAEIDIIYQDDLLLVLNKPAGIAVHEGKSVRKGDSVLGVLEANYRGTDIRPQLVHRLDKDTSGLLLVAKNSATAKELETRFQHGDVEKEYLCLVKGRLRLHEGHIDFPLPGRQGNPVHALTRYHVSRQFSDATLVRVNEALAALEREDARAAELVKLRFFAGLSVEQAALALGVTDRTARRDWRFARAWLANALQGN